MTDLDDCAARLDKLVPELLLTHSIPGASLGIRWQNQQWYGAWGVLGGKTAAPVTTDSLFQTGSIGKLFTTVITLGLLAEAGIDLDRPAVEVLPEFRVADDAATGAITFRHLLSHTAGFDGDCFADTGTDDAALARYLACLGTRQQYFRPGAAFSYNNAGFCVAGRAAEVLSGATFAAVLADRVLDRLGMCRTEITQYDEGRSDLAVGHLPAGDGSRQQAHTWSFPASLTPAGSLMVSTPRDLLAFAAAAYRLDGDQAHQLLPDLDGWDLTTPQVRLPFLGAMGTAWALGSAIYDVPGASVYGHDGGNIGQCAYLRVLPQRDLAVCLMTNVADAAPLLVEVVNLIFRELAGVDLPGYLPALARPIDPEAAPTGRYANAVAETHIFTRGSALLMRQRPRGAFGDLSAPREVELVPTAAAMSFTTKGKPELTPFTVVRVDGEGPFLHDGRIAPLVPPPGP